MAVINFHVCVPKDVTLLYPGPLQNLLHFGASVDGDVENCMELLAGEETALPERLNWLLMLYTANSMAAWQLVADGLISCGTPELIQVHTQRNRYRNPISATLKSARW